MSIFSTRELAISIYALFLLIYLLCRKKGRDAFLPVIKAAFKIKLVVPFLIVLMYAGLFVFVCDKYVSIWDWVYLKDIIIWILFAGVPICFNAVSSKLEEHYFKNIIVDNLKFAALVEFFTGTFTFHIVIELLLQPVLFIFLLLQVTTKNESTKVKTFIDKIVTVIGFVIIILTVRSAILSIGDMEFVDIAVSFMLPIVLSFLYLPIAYCFAVYSKYEILFLRMSFKEPQEKNIKFEHRLKAFWICKLSYAKVCKFLNHYVKRMYVNMENSEFENILNEFKEKE